MKTGINHRNCGEGERKKEGQKERKKERRARRDETRREHRQIIKGSKPAADGRTQSGSETIGRDNYRNASPCMVLFCFVVVVFFPPFHF